MTGRFFGKYLKAKQPEQQVHTLQSANQSFIGQQHSSARLLARQQLESACLLLLSCDREEQTGRGALRKFAHTQSDPDRTHIYECVNSTLLWSSQLATSNLQLLAYFEHFWRAPRPAATPDKQKPRIPVYCPHWIEARGCARF